MNVDEAYDKKKVKELEAEIKRLSAPWLCDCHTWPGPDEAHDYILALEKKVRELEKATKINGPG